MTTATAGTVEATFALSAEVRDKLAEQAQAEGRSEAELADEALRAYLQRKRYVAAIDEGLEDVRAGRGIDAKEEIALAREKLQARLRDAG